MNENLKLMHILEYEDISDMTECLYPLKRIDEYTKEDFTKIYYLCTSKEMFVIKNVWENFYNQGTEILTELEKNKYNYLIIFIFIMWAKNYNCLAVIFI